MSLSDTSLAARIVPISSVSGYVGESAVDPARFFDSRHPQHGHWCNPPTAWARGPEDRLETKQAVEVVHRAIITLPPVQRAVLTLRDVECWTATEVCNALELTETNQRVLLHRARSKVRRVLEEYEAS